MEMDDDDSSYDDEDRAVSSDEWIDSDAEAKPLTAHAPHSTVEGAYVSLCAGARDGGDDAAALVAAAGDEATAEQLIDALRSKLGVAVVDADDDDEGDGAR